jgi:hypothetical protein
VVAALFVDATSSGSTNHPVVLSAAKDLCTLLAPPLQPGVLTTPAAFQFVNPKIRQFDNLQSDFCNLQFKACHWRPLPIIPALHVK